MNNVKQIWYEIISLGYNDCPWIMWTDRHVKVTIGEKKVGKIYYLLNDEPLIDIPEYISFDNLDDYTQYIKETRKSFDDINIGSNIVLGMCGKFEVVKSDSPDEFKIEFLDVIQSNNSGE